jgi:aspartyl-tRNA(Asn)/glutamyl-tRNA(Gln) amidotransferase subunit A
LKATYGRVSRAGVVPLSYSLDHVTVMTRSVRDAALLLQAIAGPDPRDESAAQVPVPDFSAGIGEPIAGLRLGLARGYTYEDIDPDVTAVIGAAVEVLRGLSARVEPVALPFVRECYPLQQAILHPEAATYHYETLRRSPEKLGETALMRLDLGSVIPATAYIRAQQVRVRMRDAFRELFQGVDAIVGPALAMRAGGAGTWTTEIGGRSIDLRVAGPEYTGIYNLAGLPAVVLPAGFSSEGTPIGLQIAGPWFDEATVLRIAAAFEDVTDWHNRRPPYPEALDAQHG